MAGPVFPDLTKPKKLKNLLNGTETYDKLHVSAPVAVGCSQRVCMGSIMYQHLVDTEPRKSDLVLKQAKDFMDEYYKSLKRLDTLAHIARWTEVQNEVAKTGTYELTPTELIFGAKLAWRNAARCVGRIQWSKLQLFDCRNITSTAKMFEAICNHLKYATNNGNLRSAITIFKQRTDGKTDYRIWNATLLAYAGYKNPDGTFVGDQMNAEFTNLCLKLGWKSERTAFDLLPLILSAEGNDPQWYEYPKEIVLEVVLRHPSFEWFEELGMKWYAVPAVSGMMFDCGGIQFPASAFSGWYMSTEIGCRNLCDINRRNMLELLAKKMGLDTLNPSSLWKDKALVEINIAVLYSFQSKNVTIVDHHTASESFVKHCENEQKLRNGCPADWLWIVPPMSPSTVQVYHQEMANYYLKPSFDYQIAAAISHVWKSGDNVIDTSKPRRKLTFKQVARTILFTSSLFNRALTRRIKATVLYATETGKSEQYAKQLVDLLGHAFNAQVYCMEDYVMSQLEHESLVFVVASTFGNGDPPENGESFAQDLYNMKVQEDQKAAAEEEQAAIEKVVVQFRSKNINTETKASIETQDIESMTGFNKAKAFFSNLAEKGQKNRRSSRAFIRSHSRSDVVNAQKKTTDRRVSLSVTKQLIEPTVGPLSNVKFAVFALGSTAYPNYCAYGKYIDNMLKDLGGERILDIATGDEICGQEQAFREWAPEVFKSACDTFCLDTVNSLNVASKAMKREKLTENMLRFEPAKAAELEEALAKYHNKKAKVCHAKEKPINLHEVTGDADRSTVLIKMVTNNVYYEPGDHVGIYPENRKELVDGILAKLVGLDDPDEVCQLQVLKKVQTSKGTHKTWENYGKLPAVSVRTLLTRFLDIATPPSRSLLTFLAEFTDVEAEKDRLMMLANDSGIYEEWRYWKQPHLLEVLEEFKSCSPPVKLLLAQLTPLQPRFYSISSSPRKFENEMHLTVAVVTYKAQDGAGPLHYGVCSNYLKNLKNNDTVYLFVRNALSFHIPSNPAEPVILVGPGTGIAPFRSFWQQWESFKIDNKKAKTPKVWLLFGCRTKSMDLYQNEKKEMIEKGVMTKEFLALSREKGVPKTYVQDIVKTEADAIYNIIAKERGHIYVCGDCGMAEDMYNAVKNIVCEREKKTDQEAEDFMLQMKDDNRYHEDIFGITLRTAETNTKSRASALKRMSIVP